MSTVNTAPTPPAHDSTVSFSSGINIVLGAWLVLSPWVIGHMAESLAWNNVVVGLAVLLLAIVRLSVRTPVAVESWVNLLLGLWLIIAPFALRAPEVGQRWNCIIVGVVVAICAAISGSAGTTRTA